VTTDTTAAELGPPDFVIDLRALSDQIRSENPDLKPEAAFWALVNKLAVEVARGFLPIRKLLSNPPMSARDLVPDRREFGDAGSERPQP
jgi:hypothetical protein